jgi:creatinine amidohydrolase
VSIEPANAKSVSIEIDWTRLTGPEIREVAARGNALAVLPVGSLEQHGPHLPVITDTRTAWEISIRAARIAAPAMPVLVLPGVWTGMSEHHLPFGGTISLNFAEFRGVLAGVARSLRAIGFARLLVVNGHGGNVDPLAVAVRELAVEYEMPIVATTPWAIAAEAVAAQMETGKGPQHACEAETSVMLAMTPDTVRRDKFEEAMRQAPPAIPGRAGFSRFWSFSERAPSTGVRGDPRPATAAKGEIMLDAMAAALAEAMGDRMLWRTPDPVWSKGRGQGNTAGSALD